MSEQLQLRRGTEAQILAGTPAAGELWPATDTMRGHVGDGSTLGGWAWGLESYTPVNDAAYTIKVTDRIVSYTALSAARVVTLCSAASYPVGAELLIEDGSGNCSGTLTITINRAGSDTINGATSQVISTANGSIRLYSNGSNGWTWGQKNALTSVAQGGTGAGTASGARTNLGAAPTASPTFTGTVAMPDSSSWSSSGLAGAVFLGSTSVAPLSFSTSSALLSVATSLAFESDGNVLYYTPLAGKQGIIPSEQVQILSAAYTLTSQTAAQQLLNATAAGAVAIAGGTYEFECSFELSSMSASSGSFGFALGGSASITYSYWSMAAKMSSLTTGNTMTMTFNTAANTALAPADTNTNAVAVIKGVIRATSTGTIIPQVSLGVAAAAIVAKNARFKLTRFPVSNFTNTPGWT